MSEAITYKGGKVVDDGREDVIFRVNGIAAVTIHQEFLDLVKIPVEMRPTLGNALALSVMGAVSRFNAEMTTPTPNSQTSPKEGQTDGT